MRYFLLAILLLHGLIHLLGFAKAFRIGDGSQLTKSISRPEGLLWLLAALLFVSCIIPFLRQQNFWAILALIAVVISQVLIFGAWQDAKFGTLANLIILIVALPVVGSQNFENSFRKDVRKAIRNTQVMSEEIISEKDIASLPVPVQKYLRYTGVLGKPKVYNMRATLEGEMRGKDQDWFSFTSEQFNFFNDPTRLFYMKARVNGLSTSGYHAYQNGKARMNVKLLSLYSVVDIESEELFRAETVTFFNDLCLLAPAALIQSNISWEPIDDTSTKAIFTHRDVSISARLYFNKEGQLVNFISDDRLDVNAGKVYRFSTPLSQYEDFNGFRLASYGEAIWHYPEGEFVYGKIKIKQVEYNVDQNRKP